MIRLYDSTAVNFNTQGLGNISDFIKATVTEELNGVYELSLTYPIGGIHYNDIQLRRILFAKPTPFANPQPFRIYSISKPINKIVTINAAHISYDLTDYPVNEFTASSPQEAFTKLKANAQVSHPFTFNSTVSATGNVNVAGPRTTRSVLGNNILRAYGGEYHFDRYTIYHYQERGMDRGYRISYGKNLLDVTQEENVNDVYTGVYPYWEGTDPDTQETILIKLKDRIINTPGTFNFTRIYPLDLSSDYTNPPTEQQIRDKANQYITENKIGVPKVSLELSFLQIGETPIELGDKALVEFKEAGINSTARCVKTVYDVGKDRYETVTFGEGTSNLAVAMSNGTKALTEKIDQQKKFFDAEVGNIKIDLAEIDTALIKKADIDYLSANYARILNGYIDMAQIQDASIGTTKIKDAEITVAKMETAFVDKLTATQGKFQSAHIGKLTSDNISTTTILAEHITAQVIDAINLNVTDKISADRIDVSSLVVDEIDAGKITTGTLDADRIKASVIEAINFSTDTAQINSAKIGDIDAGKITTGSLDADLITANVIAAINASVGKISADRIDVDSIKVNNLDASVITTGSLDAERIKAQVIAAINSYTGTAKIKQAQIETLKVGNANITDLDASKITAGKISAERIDADNLQVKAANIDGTLTADKIKGGTLDAKEMTVTNLNASSITVGTINGNQIASGAISKDKFDSILSGEWNSVMNEVDQALADAGFAKQEIEVVQNELDNIEIGGRNLILTSNKFNQGSGENVTGIITAEGYLQVTSTNTSTWYTGWANGYGNVEQYFKDGDKFTVSITMKSPNHTKVPTIYIKPGMGYYSLTGTMTTEFTKFYYTGVWTKANGINPHLGFSGIVGTTIIKDWKIEKGNKATDWTPAPEDINSLIATAQSTANTANSNATTANNLLKDLSDDNKLTAVEKQDTKKEWDIIVSEKTKLEANATTYGITTEKTNYTNAYNTLNTYITPLLTSLNTTSDIVGSTFRTNFKTYYDCRQDLLNAITTKAKSLADTAQSSINNLEIGGRNLVRNTKMDDVWTSWISSVATTSKTDDGMKLTAVLENREGAMLSDLTINPKNGEQFVITANIRGNYPTLQFYLLATSGTNYRPYYNTNGVNTINTTTFTKIVVPFTFSSTNTNPTNRIFIGGIATAAGQWIEVEKNSVKIERGNKATDWSPAPEDIENMIDSIEIGGRNLLRNGDLKRGDLQHWSINGVASYAFIDNKNCIKVGDGTATIGLYQPISYSSSDLSLYTISFEAKGIGSNSTARVGFLNELGANETFILTDSWKRYSYTSDHAFATSVAGKDLIHIYPNASQFYITNIKVEKGNRATDWSPAPEDINANIAAAQSTANTASSNANAANSLLADLSNDNKLTAVEKQETKKEWDVIVSEKTKIEANATTYGITTEKTNYTNAYNTLNTYITPLLTSLTTTSDIVGTTFRTNFKNYYDCRQDLLNAITAKAKTLADTAQNSVNNLQIGGTNLVRFNSLTNLKSGSSTKEFVMNAWAHEVLDNKNVLKMFKVGEKYTVSFDAEIITRATPPTLYSLQCGFVLYSRANGEKSVSFTARDMSTLGAKRRISVTFTCPELTDQVMLAYTNRYTTNDASPIEFDTVKFTNFKIETGNKATDWSPSPEDVDDTIDNVQVGGRNLLRDSRTIPVMSNNGNLYPATHTTMTEGNRTFIRTTRTNPTLNPTIFSIYNGIGYFTDDISNSTITVSFKARTSQASSWTYMAQFYSDTITTYTPYSNVQVDIGTEWKTYSLVLETPAAGLLTGLRVIPSGLIDGSKYNLSSFYIDLCEWKVEFGNKATDWTPAPEDVDAKIETVTSIANGKNTIYYATTAPSITGKKVDDIWFDTDDGNRIYRFTGSAWAAAQFGQNALAANSITANHIVAGTISAGKLAADSVVASNIAADAIVARNIKAGEVTAGKLSVNAVVAGNIAANAVTSDKIIAGAVKAEKLDVAEIFANSGFIKQLSAVSIDATQITTGKISGDRIEIKGLISYDALDTELQPIFDVSGDRTYINGGMLATNSIKANSLDLKSGLSVTGPDNTLTFAIDDEGSVTVNGLLRSGNFDEEKRTGYRLTTDGKAILNNATVRGVVQLPNAGLTNDYDMSQNEGRNLIRNTATPSTITSASTNNYTYQAYPYNPEPSTTYTISFNVKILVGTITKISVYGSYANNQAVVDIVNGRCVYTFTTPASLDSGKDSPTIWKHVLIYAGQAGATAGNSIQVSNIKLEKGSSATDWSPAPEDNINPVRMWAGGSYELRESAPFRVMQNGDVYATNATLTGILYGSVDSGSVHINDTHLTVVNDTVTPTVEYFYAGTEDVRVNTDFILGTPSSPRLAYSNDDRILFIDKTRTIVNTTGINLTINNTSSWENNIMLSSNTAGFDGKLGLGHATGEWLNTHIISTSGPKNDKHGDIMFRRQNWAENIDIMVRGNVSVSNSVQSTIHSIEMRSVNNEGWGFYAT